MKGIFLWLQRRGRILNKVEIYAFRVSAKDGLVRLAFGRDPGLILFCPWGRYQRAQKYLVAGSLILSSGATLALVSSGIPATYAWVKPVLTLTAAILSAWSLVAKNERSSIDCADLHFSWNTLAMDYESLWANVYADDAETRLTQLRRSELNSRRAAQLCRMKKALC